MRSYPRRAAPLSALLLAATLMLSACESSEEKAEGYYQSALTLLAEGDEDRALVELRNVFKYDGFHQKARRLYADRLMARGEVEEAYSQYLRLVEQYPDTLDVRQILAETALARGDWDEVARHGEAAVKLAPQDRRSQALRLALDYRAATLARDEAARAQGAAGAETALQQSPDNLVLRRILIDHRLSGPDPQSALPLIDGALAQAPDMREFHMLKLQLLAQAGDGPAMGAQLKDMVARFPEDSDLRGALVTWYLANEDFAGAEAYLRQLAGPATGTPDGHIAVVELLRQVKGNDAARAELAALTAANEGTPGADLYRALEATFDFEEGQTAQAMAALTALLAEAEPSDQTQKIQVMLARMHEALGEGEAALALTAQVLEEDPSQTEALKLRARAHIAADRPGEAIVDLRAALGQAPRDVEALTLLAEAHARDGSPDLAAERLALAVEVSNGGAEESLRYAQFLRRDGRLEAAQSVLGDALSRPGAPPELWAVFGEIALARKDWSGTERAIAGLGALKTPEAGEAAEALQANLHWARAEVDESLTFLQKALADRPGDVQALALLVQTHLQKGDVPGARAALNQALREKPGDMALRLISASLSVIEGDGAKAEADYRALIAEAPESETPVQLLHGLLLSQDREEEAALVLNAALQRQPQSPLLRWMKASALEAEGDAEGAIALYEALYAEDSGNMVLANNLASLLANNRRDAASLDRAYLLARRLRGIEVPAFQDTYGWAEYRRGNLDAALAPLEAAAKGLPADPLAQFHLGMVYADLGRKDAAIVQFEKMLALDPLARLPEAAQAEERLTGLRSAALAPQP